MKKTISLVLLLTLGLAMSGLAQAATITVGPGADYDFDTIQAGIDAVVDGDTVLVAPGEYVITEPITFQGKAITVTSEAGPDGTAIRMGTPVNTNRGSVIVFENNETSASVLDGFTITGGKGIFIQGVWGGGGILFVASSGTLNNCVIVQNRSRDAGGGVCCAYDSSVTMNNCTIMENSAEGGGGGGGVIVYSGSSATLTNCDINRNSANIESGGGICCAYDSLVTINNCTIIDNSTQIKGGGGIMSYDKSLATLTNSLIARNSTQWGGGVMSERESSSTLTNCIICENSASLEGGGVVCYNKSLTTITNCTIWGNSAAQSGGGVECLDWSSSTVTNSIIWKNSAPKGRELSVQDAASTLTITYSNVADGQTGVRVDGGSTLDWGVGNIDADPCFADPNNDDYHLKSQAGRWDPNNQVWIPDDVTSPCIDAGDPMSSIGLEPFPSGGFVNMGAYGCTAEASKAYFGEPVCNTIIAGDINGDGQVNRADLEIMALHWTDDEPLLLP